MPGMLVDNHETHALIYVIYGVNTKNIRIFAISMTNTNELIY